VPFKSKSQERLFFAKQARGELKPGTALAWAHETRSIKALPERVGKTRAKKSRSTSRSASRPSPSRSSR
jgi:hypothetical protein